MKIKKMPLSDGAEMIISRLISAGFGAYAVGGCVRDFLIGRQICDYDITTSATPDEVGELFFDCRTVPTGIKHGTLTIVLPDGSYEVTTYRLDGGYLDGRHPESVTFSRRIKDDLSRRDFTVNAIAYNHIDGFIDLFDGFSDIEKKRIRAVGDPKVRFDEDALRILRAVRFSSQLGFSLDDTTAKAVHECVPLLSRVSRERCYVEIYKLFDGDYAHGVIREYGDVIAHFTGITDPVLADEESFLSCGALARMLAYFALGKSSPASEFFNFCTNMKTDSRTREVGTRALEILDKCDPLTVRGAARMIFDEGEEAVELATLTAVALGRLPKESLECIKSAKAAYPTKLSELDVRGTDLIRIGITGKEVGEVLRGLMYKVIDGECQNEKNSLISLASELFSSKK